MNNFDVLVISHNDWWSVICPELEISGFGESQEAAMAAFERSFTSTMLARFRASFLEPKPSRAKASTEEFPNLANLRGGQVVHRTSINLGHSLAA